MRQKRDRERDKEKEIVERGVGRIGKKRVGRLSITVLHCPTPIESTDSQCLKVFSVGNREK